MVDAIIVKAARKKRIVNHDEPSRYRFVLVSSGVQILPLTPSRRIRSALDQPGGACAQSSQGGNAGELGMLPKIKLYNVS